MSAPVLEGHDLQIGYGGTKALDGVSLAVAAGEVVAVMGPSGSGKSTLLHCLAGVVRPDSGTVTFDGSRLDAMGEGARSSLRLRRFGFVFQFGELVPELTLAENVALPLLLSGVRRKEAAARSLRALEDLGVADAGSRPAARASGGQAQRAAVARALVHDPAVVFADEPTGALDTVTGERVLEALVGAARERGAAVVVVTHEASVASYADREIVLRDGRVVVGAMAGR